MFRGFVKALLSGWYFVFHHLRVTGRENLPAGGAYMLIMNHTNFRDAALAVLLTPPGTRLMAKKELFKYKPVAAFISGLGAFPVDREGSDMVCMRTALSTLKEGRPLVIFPEGHRYTDGQIHEFKQGAAFIAMRAGVPVIPARVRTGWLPFQRVNIAVGAPLTLARAGGNGAVEKACAEMREQMLKL